MRAALGFVIALAGCAATKSQAPDGGAADAADATVDGASGHVGTLVLPPIPDTGYTPGDQGGYLLGPPLAAADIQQTLPNTSSTMCNRLRGIVRDFKGALPAVGGTLEPGGHPDFEVFQGETPTTGLVAPASTRSTPRPPALPPSASPAMPRAASSARSTARCARTAR